MAIVTGAGGGLGFEYPKLHSQWGVKVVFNELGCDFAGNGADVSMAEHAAQLIRCLATYAKAELRAYHQYWV